LNASIAPAEPWALSSTNLGRAESEVPCGSRDHSLGNFPAAGSVWSAPRIVRSTRMIQSSEASVARPFPALFGHNTMLADSFRGSHVEVPRRFEILHRKGL